ncbi:hypothetical protein EI94DRAFT_1568094, partial [Lactarius quietus]
FLTTAIVPHLSFLVVVIPKSAILSTRSCALAAHISHSPCGHEAILALALALLLGSRSRWAGYLQSLPTDQNWEGIALFWGFTSQGLDSDGDAVEAIQWLNGTEARKHFVLLGEPRTLILVRSFNCSRHRYRRR